MDPAIWSILRRECGFVLLLPIDVLILVGWLIRRKAKKPKWPATWEAAFILLHLVFGILVLWLYNDSAHDIVTPFDIVTLVFWGPVFGAWVVRQVRKNREASDDTNEETKVVDKQETAPKLEVSDEKDPVVESGEDDSGQEEPQVGRRGRRRGDERNRGGT